MSTLNTEEKADVDSAIKEMFSLIDANGDGMIDEAECKALAHFLDCNADNAWKQFQVYDADKDGCIEINEARALQGPMRPIRTRCEPPWACGVASDLRALCV